MCSTLHSIVIYSNILYSNGVYFNIKHCNIKSYPNIQSQGGFDADIMMMMMIRIIMITRYNARLLYFQRHLQ